MPQKAFPGLWPPLLFSTFLGNVITMLLANRAVQSIKVSEAETPPKCFSAGSCGKKKGEGRGCLAETGRSGFDSGLADIGFCCRLSADRTRKHQKAQHMMSAKSGEYQCHNMT